MRTTGKQAILVVSFGSSYEEARRKAIEPIEQAIQEHFPEYEVKRAFTSNRIIQKLKEQGIFIPTPQEGLEQLIQGGAREILVQPLHLIPGFEYEKIQQVVETYQRDDVKITLGQPLLMHPEDYDRVVEVLKTQLPEEKAGQGVILVGHGSEHEANRAYEILETHLQKAQLPVIVGTIEEGPGVVMEKLKAAGYRKVVLMPFLVVAGDHVFNDLVGEDEDSWKNVLTEGGYSVTTYTKGLGENPAFQQLYVAYVRALKFA